MDPEVEMELNRVEIHEKRDKQLIQLQEKGGKRNFQIVIGLNEAAEIHRKVTGQEPIRPMTHDLIGSLIGETGCRIDRVVVSDLIDSTYYALIHLTKPDGTEARIDARPSDAIALATQFRVPIFVAEKVLDRLSQGGF